VTSESSFKFPYLIIAIASFPNGFWRFSIIKVKERIKAGIYSKAPFWL